MIYKTSWKDSKTITGTKMGSTAGNDQNTLLVWFLQIFELKCKKTKQWFRETFLMTCNTIKDTLDGFMQENHRQNHNWKYFETKTVKGADETK